MKRWKPPLDTTRKEQLLLKRLTRTKKLFAFLRLHRHELFNDEFQAELEGMYRSTGAGCEPLPPAVLCMISLLQAYTDISDAEAVELTVTRTASCWLRAPAKRCPSRPRRPDRLLK